MSSDDALKYQSGEPPRPDEVPAGTIVSPDTRRANRVPRGQSRTRKWPVLDAFGPPQIPPTWKLEIFGAVEHPLSFSRDEFAALPRVKVYADFHCVTHWSRLGNTWEGVSTRELLERAGVKRGVQFVVLHGHDHGWTTNLPLEHFLAEDALVADLHDGHPLTLEHGGPLRAIVPQLYAWKSAKWLKGIELVEKDQPGYWERGGYHLRGDPWVTNDRNPDGERFREDW
jgi:DMSO/TMAO reductase YedYZ molybdopterin-dependent catalytic subunit